MSTPTIRTNQGFTIRLRNGEEWVARKNRKIVARNADWIMLMRDINPPSQENMNLAYYNAYLALKKNRNESIVGYAIRKVCSQPTVNSVYALIKSLKTSIADNPPMLKRILGAAYPLVMKCN